MIFLVLFDDTTSKTAADWDWEVVLSVCRSRCSSAAVLLDPGSKRESLRKAWRAQRWARSRGRPARTQSVRTRWSSNITDGGLTGNTKLRLCFQLLCPSPLIPHLHLKISINYTSVNYHLPLVLLSIFSSSSVSFSLLLSPSSFSPLVNSLMSSFTSSFLIRSSSFLLFNVST